MSSLLRYPGIVPSLFSDGIDCDISPADSASLPRRAVALVAYGLTLLWLHRDSVILKPGSAFLGSLIALICSKPLLQAFLVGGAGPH